MGRLENKRAIVTGGASGFGEGIVRKFLSEGALVLIADLNLDGADKLARELGDNAFACQANVGEGKSVCDMVETAFGILGGIDILVNNAGTTHLPSSLEEVSEEDFDQVFNVNCKSVYLTAKYVVPAFKAQAYGSILNMASTAGVSPRPRLNWYNASKGWMNTATKAMAVELAPQGIRVNAINPVAGETPLLKK
ncbi:MAG: glucose 1-dehydrogenase, partial [Pseudomonadota bacterium]